MSLESANPELRLITPTTQQYERKTDFYTLHAPQFSTTLIKVDCYELTDASLPLDLHMILKFAVAKQSLVSDCLTTGRTIFAWRNCVLLSDSSPRRLLRKASNRNLGPESY